MTVPFSSAESSFPIGSTVAEKYRVESVLGTGGMGAVLEATHVTLGHRVALKVLHPTAVGVGDAIPRFLREARATAALESEHVVRIFDIGTTPDGMPFLVMERLNGVDLDDLLGQLGALPVGLALECVYQAAQGVRAAHAAGIIHRDLKPSNLFLGKRTDGSPLIKVLDFGISKLQEEGTDIRLTETRTIVGSPQYMSPEQVRDARSVSERSDVWALGAILHELLEAGPAFTGDTLPSVCAAIVSDEPAPLTRSDVPAEVDELRLRCLVKDPASRIASAGDLISALEPLRTAWPHPKLENLKIVFPERSSRQSQVITETGARRAIHTSPTIADSSRAVESVKETSGVRVAVAGAPHTLNSATLSGPPSNARGGRRWLLAGAAATLVLAAGAAFFLLRPAATPPEPLPEVPTANQPVLSLLDISTSPVGALITEDGRVLGRTPANLELSFTGRRTRELELHLEGHRPHRLTVSEATLSQPIEVQLVALPPAEPASDQIAAAEAPVAPPPTARPVTIKRPAPRDPPKAADPEPAASDIRMSR